jgi:hypothetical protein
LRSGYCRWQDDNDDDDDDNNQRKQKQQSTTASANKVNNQPATTKPSEAIMDVQLFAWLLPAFSTATMLIVVVVVVESLRSSKPYSTCSYVLLLR